MFCNTCLYNFWNTICRLARIIFSFDKYFFDNKIHLQPKKKYLLHLAVLTFFLSFFSKQVPSAYALILYGPILIFYLIKNKNFEPLKIILFSATTLSLIFYLILRNICLLENNSSRKMKKFRQNFFESIQSD